ncbi:TPR and ankyrin repeat-containing protein [Arachis hypogaea]|nr:TPR and ankyrin repeat-containing protein [Arachis hypogaea]
MGDMLNWSSRRKKAIDYSDHGFMDTVFSWSLENILNEDLYRDKVKQIDMRFSSIEHYFGSYVYPLLEETRTALCSSMEILSSAPFAEVISLKELYSTDKKLYGVKTGIWKNRFSGHGKELYKTLSGDVFLLADFKPETANDLQRVGRMWTFVLSAGIPEQELEEDTDIVSSFKFTASKDIDVDELREKSLFMVFLTNIIPNRRIWKALHMSRNSNLIKKILCASDVVRHFVSCNGFFRIVF